MSCDSIRATTSCCSYFFDFVFKFTHFAYRILWQQPGNQVELISEMVRTSATAENQRRKMEENCAMIKTTGVGSASLSGCITTENAWCATNERLVTSQVPFTSPPSLCSYDIFEISSNLYLLSRSHSFSYL